MSLCKFDVSLSGLHLLSLTADDESMHPVAAPAMGLRSLSPLVFAPAPPEFLCKV